MVNLLEAVISFCRYCLKRINNAKNYIISRLHNFMSLPQMHRNGELIEELQKAGIQSALLDAEETK
jgi:hypothetical protein